MFKMKAVYTTKLNAVIYNNLVKVFNDAANNESFENCRDKVIALRKQFPTYNELLSLDLSYAKNYISAGSGQGRLWYGQIQEAEVVYNIEIVRAAANNFEPTLLIHGH